MKLLEKELSENNHQNDGGRGQNCNQWGLMEIITIANYVARLAIWWTNVGSSLIKIFNQVLIQIKDSKTHHKTNNLTHNHNQHLHQLF